MSLVFLITSYNGSSLFKALSTQLRGTCLQTKITDCWQDGELSEVVNVFEKLVSLHCFLGPIALTNDFP